MSEPCHECHEFREPNLCEKFGTTLSIEQKDVTLKDGNWILMEYQPADGCKNAAFKEALRKHEKKGKK